MERKWTPGPWRIVWYDAGDRDEWDSCPMIAGSEEYDLAVVHWDGFKQKYWKSADGKQSEIESNAHLIASAPDLYDALQAMVDYCNAECGSKIYPGHQANQALAKARGGQ